MKRQLEDLSAAFFVLKIQVFSAKVCQKVCQGTIRAASDSRNTQCLCGKPGLHFIHHLEDIEFQIIGAVGSPQDRMIAGLSAELDLT